MATNRLNFTQKSLSNIAPPAKGRTYFYDTRVDGLVLSVTSNGTKTFQVYRWVKQTGPVRVTLGKADSMSIEQARRQAKQTIADIADGINPNAKKRADKARAITLGEVYAAYVKQRDLKPRTHKDYDIVMGKYLADWQHLPITEIKKDRVERRHEQLGKKSPAQANMAMRVLRAVLNYAAAKWDDEDGNPIIAYNPVQKLSALKLWHRVDRRRTSIKIHELPSWLAAVESLRDEHDHPKAAVVADWLLFMLFTGLRYGEASRLRWEDVDFKGKYFVIHDTKNKEQHELPLSDYLYDMLKRRHQTGKKSPYVFPSEVKPNKHITEPKRWIERVRKHSDIDFSPHDLRRTFTSIAESLDFSRYALKRLLNHKISKADVTDAYIVTDLERLRKPMQQITNYILKVAGVRDSAEIAILSNSQSDS